jgi:hypothetical protein
MFRYYVVVNDPEFKDDVHLELTSLSTGDVNIPDREVECVNPHSASEYIGEFMLTPEEAEALEKDPRITAVHRDPLELGARIIHHTVQLGTFSKDTTQILPTELNWGLARCINKAEPFGANTSLGQFTYNLDGAGVDIVFLDTGIIKYHPEFAVNPDGTGGTRVVDIDWSKFGVMAPNGTGSWVGDADGHGTNVASIAAGNTNGWAKKANIYMINVVDFTNNPNIYTDPISALQTIRLWHLSKPTNNLGWRVPTVCSNSWGYDQPYTNLTATVYQGTTYPAVGPTPAYGQVPGYGDVLANATHGIRIPAIDAEVLSCQNAGIIFVGAAGNNSMKIDIPGGADYNNYWIDNTGNKYYYHQGTSPTATANVICVGATSTTSAPEHKIYFSSTGPRIDVFAPGSLIMGAFSSSTYVFNAVVDPRSSVSTSTLHASFYLNKISGTSQATPQVAGVVACMLEARPYYNQSYTNSWIKQNSTPNLLNETYYGPTTSTVYLNYASLQGAQNAHLFQPFNNPIPTTISTS